MKSINPNRSRIEFSSSDSLESLLALRDDSRVRVLQFNAPVPVATLKALDEGFFRRRPEVDLRVYGFYSQTCDLSFLRELNYVQKFRADCLIRASGEEHLSALHDLTVLGIGIFELASFDFLKAVSLKLNELFITETKAKLSIRAVARFEELQKLYLRGTFKDCDTLQHHQKLQSLAITALSKDTLCVLPTLPNLKSLELGLGRMESLDALETLDGLEELNVWWVKLLSNVDALGELRNLRKLTLEKQKHITHLPSLRELKHLEIVNIWGLPSLQNLSGLVDAPVLRELTHTESKLKPTDYIPLLKKETLKSARVFFRSKAENAEFDRLCLEHDVRSVEREGSSFTS